MSRLMYVLCLLLVLVPNLAGADFKKTKIAVLDFQLQGEPFDNDDMGTIVAEWFITAMVREGRFDVVERRLLEKVISEQKLAMSGVVDATSATKIGKLLGVKVIITGSVMKLKDLIEVNARIIDVESASIIAAENVRSLAATNLQGLVVEMSAKIIRNFPLEGYIVNRSGESVTLDLGLRTGVKEGMRFMVYKEGQVIKHPKTGEVLDVERIQTGTITISRVMQKICTAEIVEETSPGSINYGQLVKSMVEGPRKSTLTVNTSPQSARVRILNIVPAYQSGMELPPGPYHIEVSAVGYQTVSQWLSLEAGEEKVEMIALDPVQSTTATTPPAAAPVYSQPSQTVAKTPAAPAVSGQNAKYIKMLQSKSLLEKRDAAKMIARARLRDTVVLDVVEQELLNGYRQGGSDNHHIDTMSWLCKALGASGVEKYRSTLSKVASQGSHRKLRGYAAKSLNQL